MTQWILLIAAVALAVVLATCLFAVVQSRSHARRSLVISEENFGKAKRQLATAHHDLQVQTQFIQEFLTLSKQLDSLSSSRNIPQVLLAVIVKTFEPSGAVVLLRKEGDRLRRMRAVAVHPGTSKIVGMDFPAHEGELGLLLRAKRVMTREDLLQATSRTSIVGKRQSLPGFVMSIAAPMIFNDECHGVLCVSNPRRTPSASREVLGLIAQMGALTYHNAAQFKEVRRSAQLDKLTQVDNKASIRDFLEREINRARKKGHRSSVLLFDLDNFKNYNDTNGHMAGDDLLRDLARLVDSSTRDYDRLGRFGGEEFLLVLPETDAEGARVVAEKVRSIIAAHPFPHREKQPLGIVSMSGGIATFPENGRDADTMLKLADEALYEAKKGGRNAVGQARRLAITSRLGHAG